MQLDLFSKEDSKVLAKRRRELWNEILALWRKEQDEFFLYGKTPERYHINPK
jgi:hypothetical protein